MGHYKLNSREMQYFQDIVDRNLVQILSLPGVYQFGVGYKMTKGVTTDEVCLVALVSKKQTQLPASQRVPKTIEGVQTDVIGIEPLTMQSPARSKKSREHIKHDHSHHNHDHSQHKGNGRVNNDSKTARKNKKNRRRPLATTLGAAGAAAGATAGLIPDRNKRFNPITGGVPIRNRKIGVDNVAVLGAIVFDKNGNPMGLSAQHAIGDQQASKFSERAKKGDPIHHPLSLDDSDKIGTLASFDKVLDAALFEIDENYPYQAKMQSNDVSGNAQPFELNEAERARIGQIVECPARRTHTKGCVHYYMSYVSKWTRRSNQWVPSKICRVVIIEFLNGFTPTKSGDSGALWIDTKSKAPVAIHTGINHVWLAGDRWTTIAYGSCMEQIAKWGNFRFTIPRGIEMRKELEPYETSFMNTKSGLLAFCSTPGRAAPLVVKKLDSNLKTVDEASNKILPMSGIAVTKFKDNIYGSWRSANDQIHVAGLKRNSLEFKKPSTSPWKTRRKPAMATFNDRLILAYIHSETKRLCVAHCDRNWSWHQFEVSNIQSTCAPALAVFKNRIYLSWSDLNNTMKLAEFNINSTSRTILYYDSMGNRKTHEDTSLAVVDGKLCLAYTTLRNELRIIESSDFFNWTLRRKDATQKSAPPNLVALADELIYAR